MKMSPYWRRVSIRTATIFVFSVVGYGVGFGLSTLIVWIVR